MYKTFALTVLAAVTAYLVSLSPQLFLQESAISRSFSTSGADSQLEYMALNSVSRRAVKKVLSMEQEEACQSCS